MFDCDKCVGKKCNFFSLDIQTTCLLEMITYSWPDYQDDVKVKMGFFLGSTSIKITPGKEKENEEKKKAMITLLFLGGLLWDMIMSELLSENVCSSLLKNSARFQLVRIYNLIFFEKWRCWGTFYVSYQWKTNGSISCNIDRSKDAHLFVHRISSAAGCVSLAFLWCPTRDISFHNTWHQTCYPSFQSSSVSSPF